MLKMYAVTIYLLGNSHMEIIQERANEVLHTPCVKVDFDVVVKQ